MSVSIVMTLDTRRVKMKTGKYPVKLLVTFGREPRRYQTIYDLTESEYENLSASRVSEPMQKIRGSLKLIKRKAEDAATALNPFSFEDFEKGFVFDNPLLRQRKHITKAAAVGYTRPDDFDYRPYYKKFPLLKAPIPDPGTFGFTFLSYIKKLIQQGRVGTAICYHCSYKSFIRFRGEVRFTDVTVSYLYQYEQWTKQGGMAKVTQGIYLLNLRAIFNEAIADGIISKEKCYPFGRRKYQIPTGRNIKKALKLEQIEKIYYYEPACENERRAKAFWLFCYFGNGINPKDVALLKYKNIHGEYIIFERAKTERTGRTDPKPITIFLNEDMWAMIEEWGNHDKNPENFIFPILYEGVTPLRLYDLVQNFIGTVNKWMEIIGGKLGIDKKLTTIVSRHSFSTVMKNSGASTEFIQEALGHTDKRTTENYLDSFEKEIKKEFAAKLVPFKKDPKENNDFVKVS
jgi:integrase/recombinase XerD